MVVTTLASITILVASLVALTQDNLKRRLAYSTIGQLSYMVLGAGMVSAAGMMGGMLHIVMHAFGKITLFFCAGAIYVASGKKYISQMDRITSYNVCYTKLLRFHILFFSTFRKIECKFGSVVGK